MRFKDKFDNIVKKNNSLLCIGLDPEMEKLPRCLTELKNCVFDFNKNIIDLTHDLVCAYKPNIAFYEAMGLTGLEQLKKTIDYLHEKYPEIPIILDAKRGDIGHTSAAYARYVFDYLKADAVTLHPYLGKDALQPFLDRKDKGCIILCRTSNPGAGEFQDLKFRNVPLYEIIARKVAANWNKNKNCLLVVGATYPQELAKVRRIAGDMTFLVPGIGAQGGDIKKTVIAGMNSKKAGMIINSSRAIIFAENPREETRKLRDQINNFRK